MACWPGDVYSLRLRRKCHRKITTVMEGFTSVLSSLFFFPFLKCLCYSLHVDSICALQVSHCHFSLIPFILLPSLVCMQILSGGLPFCFLFLCRLCSSTSPFSSCLHLLSSPPRLISSSVSVELCSCPVTPKPQHSHNSKHLWDKSCGLNNSFRLPGDKITHSPPPLHAQINALSLTHTHAGRALNTHTHSHTQTHIHTHSPVHFIKIYVAC